MEYLVIFLMLCLPACVYGGYRFALWSMNKKMGDENAFLREQNQKLKDVSDYWADQASGKLQLHQTIIQNHNLNLSNTLGAVMQLLQGLQSNPNSNMSADDRLKVEKIIEQAKGIV